MTNKTTLPTKAEILKYYGATIVDIAYQINCDISDLHDAMDAWAAVRVNETITDLYACLDPSNRLGYEPEKVKEWFEKHPKTE